MGRLPLFPKENYFSAISKRDLGYLFLYFDIVASLPKMWESFSSSYFCEQ